MPQLLHRYATVLLAVGAVLAAIRLIRAIRGRRSGNTSAGGILIIIGCLIVAVLFALAASLGAGLVNSAPTIHSSATPQPARSSAQASSPGAEPSALPNILSQATTKHCTAVLTGPCNGPYVLEIRATGSGDWRLNVNGNKTFRHAEGAQAGDHFEVKNLPAAPSMLYFVDGDFSVSLRAEGCGWPQ